MIKKTIFVLLICFCGILHAQQQQVWSTIAKGASLPANVPRSGYLFFRTSDSTMHVSTGITWVLIPNSISGGGDITAVTAGDGLKGGGTSGSVTVDVNPKRSGAGRTIVTSDSLLLDINSVDSTIVQDGTLDESDYRTASVGANALAPSGVTSGSYTNANITVTADGVITAASSGSAGSAIGDTVEYNAFESLDVTSTNASAISFTLLSIRRTIGFYSYDDANSDTLIFSLSIPEHADSLVYVVPIFRANTGTGNYRVNFLWEFTDNDAAIDNSLTYTNSHAFTITAPSASGDIRSYRNTLPAGSSRATGTARWIDGMFIRIGGDGADTASGNLDLMGFMLGFSRTR